MASSAPKKKEKTAVLDGLVLDLFKRTETPLELLSLTPDEHLESIQAIHRYLHLIQKQERDRVARVTARVAPLESAEARMKELEKWLKDNNVQLEGLQLKSDLPQGCGVVATREFKEGESVVRVPHSLMMSDLSAVQSKEVGPLCACDPWLANVQSLILVMHLLFEKHRTEPVSKWSGYIRSLPGQLCVGEKNEEGPDMLLLPLAFSLQTVEELQGTSALEDYHRVLRTIAKQYCHMRTALNRLKELSPAVSQAATDWFSWAEFRWAVSTVMMRQNLVPAVPPNPEKLPEGTRLPPSMALIPLFDLFNHEQGPMSSNFDASSLEIELSAKRNFKEGEQVLMSYGARTNSLLLFYNGFLPNSNPHDRILLPVSIPESDPLKAKKLKLLKLLDLPDSAKVEMTADFKPPPILHNWLRVAALASEEDITREMRKAIEEKTKETARQLEEQRLAANGHAEEEHSKQEAPEGGATNASAESAPAGAKPEGLSKANGHADVHQGLSVLLDEPNGQDLFANYTEEQLGFFITLCSNRINGIRQGAATAHAEGVPNGEAKEQGPKGLGLGLKKGPAKAEVRAKWFSGEVDLVRKLREGEKAILEKAMEKCKAYKALLAK